MFKYGIHNIGVIPIPYMAGSPGGTIPVDFALGDLTFTPLMDKRLSSGPFDRAPIFQGRWDGTGTPDVVSFPRGALLANQTDLWYANFDPHQGSAVKWWTPEQSTGDQVGYASIWQINATYFLRYNYINDRYFLYMGGQSISLVQPVVAGTTYCIVARWDSKNTLDGTNYLCLSVNDAHTFGGVSALVSAAPAAAIYIGSDGTIRGSNAIIEGFTIYRRVLYDGTYGTDIGNGDEINRIWAAGAGADPCTITGSWDVVSCVPTNQADEALQTTGEAWSMPHADSIPDVTFMEDGGLPGTPYAIEYNATTTSLNCGSDVDIDNIADDAFTAEAWIRYDGEGESGLGMVFSKRGGTNSVGWQLYCASDRVVGSVFCATTSAASQAYLSFADGKWHHITMFFDDAGDRKIYIALDGVWAATYAEQLVGVGAIVSDAARDLTIGELGNGRFTFNGGIAWAAISNNDRHNHGTDFIPPRAFPGDDANYLASWEMDEGTGGAVANTGNQGGAGSGAANRDGTLTNGSWSSIWEMEGTPVIPQSVEFNFATTNLDATSGANIDNLPSGANGFTAEGYFRADGAGGTSTGTFWNKVGWYMRFDSATTIRVFIDYDTTDIDETFTWTPDGIRRHWMLTYNENGADRFARVYLDGVLIHTTAASAGNYVADAASTLYIGNNAGGTAAFDGGVGWQALSDLVRTGATFVPNGSELARANDGNMHLRYAMTDGAGATVADTSGNAYNGTLTNYVWNNTPDMAVDEPGARDFEWGYNVGSDGANDGITIIQGVTAEQDYVNRLFLSYGQSGRAWPEVYLYDNTGAVQIGATYSLPRMHDVHTGGAASAVLVNANGHFTQQLVGWVVYNIDDGSVGTITAVSGDQTTITAPLAGGGSNDWQNGEVHLIRPPAGDSYSEHPIATENIFVFRTPAACISTDFKARNAAGEGVMQVQQYEVYESVLDNGDHESLNGGFPGAAELITGWANADLDAGDTEPEAATIHAGAQSLEWNPNAINEGMTLVIAGVGDGIYFALGGWEYGDENGYLYIGPTGANGLLQSSNVNRYVTFANDDFWKHGAGVLRSLAANPTIGIHASSGAVGDRFSDDIYMFPLDPITLTVTPASEANSAEGGGIRIDGRDTSPSNIPAGYVFASGGWFRFNWRPRHDAADLDSFGAADPTLIHVWGDANNNIQVFVNAANQIRLAVTDGGVLNTNDWNCAGLITADTEYLMEVLYTGTWCRLYQDGVQVAEVVTPITMVTVPTIIYWGHAQSSDGNVDAVYIAP